MNTYPSKIKEFRLRAFLTQVELAKLLDISPTTVNKHEAGTRSLTRSEIIKYANVFKVETYELFQDPTPLDEPVYVGDTRRQAVPEHIRQRIEELDPPVPSH